MIWAGAGRIGPVGVAIRRHLAQFEGMEIVYLIIGGLLLASVIFAIVEKRRGRAFVVETDGASHGNSHADREMTRIDAEISDRTMGHRDPH